MRGNYPQNETASTYLSAVSPITEFDIVEMSSPEYDAEESSSHAAPADEGWMEVQKRALSNWVNNKLHKAGHKTQLKDLVIDMETGIVLIKLVEGLAHGKMPKKWVCLMSFIDFITLLLEVPLELVVVKLSGRKLCVYLLKEVSYMSA